MEFSNLSKNLQKAVEQAEDIAIEYIRNDVSFAPYIFSEKKKIKKIISNSLDEGIEAAMEQIEKMVEDTVILIYKDHISLKDGDFDAVISQVYNDNEDSGYSFGLLYKIIDNKIVFLNKRVFLGELRNCLIF